MSPAIGERRFDSAPDLVIELICPTGITLDHIIKIRAYEPAAMSEYRIIDPRPNQQQADNDSRDEEEHQLLMNYYSLTLNAPRIYCLLGIHLFGKAAQPSIPTRPAN